MRLLTNMLVILPFELADFFEQDFFEVIHIFEIQILIIIMVVGASLIVRQVYETVGTDLNLRDSY